MCSHTSWSTMVASQSATSVPDISASHFCTWEWTIVLIFGNQSTVTTGITQYVQSYLLVHRVCLTICNICTRHFCITLLHLGMDNSINFWKPVYCHHWYNTVCAVIPPGPQSLPQNLQHLYQTFLHHTSEPVNEDNSLFLDTSLLLAYSLVCEKYLDCINTIANSCPPWFPEVHVCSTSLKAC